MRSLNDYILEGLADWDEGDFEKSIKKETSKVAIEKQIINWIKENTIERIIIKDLEFDWSTTPITVNYTNCKGEITFKKSIDVLTNGLFQWGKVECGFDCSRCMNLKSLEGGPKYVGYRFICWACKNLESLEGGPEYVGTVYDCSG